MINEKMKELGSNRSVIRELFEYGKKRISEVGAENVYDFSLGNPRVTCLKNGNLYVFFEFEKLIRREYTAGSCTYYNYVKVHDFRLPFFHTSLL